MAACTFFGHRDCPCSIQPKLYEILTDLIENHSVDTFYVGRQGTFDSIVHTVLKELALIYPHIHYAIVLDRMPTKQDGLPAFDFSNTLLPEGIETIPPRFAISWRNKWMIKHSDYVVTYITRAWGGAAKFSELAEKQKKTLIIILDGLS